MYAGPSPCWHPSGLSRCIVLVLCMSLLVKHICLCMCVIVVYVFHICCFMLLFVDASLICVCHFLLRSFIYISFELTIGLSMMAYVVYISSLFCLVHWLYMCWVLYYHGLLLFCWRPSGLWAAPTRGTRGSAPPRRRRGPRCKTRCRL